MEVTTGPSLADYLTVIVKRRSLLYKSFLIGTLVSVIISFCIPNQYTASTTILPPNPQQDMMYGLISPSIISSFGGASGLTTLLGGGSRPSDLFAAILNSGQITGAIVNKHNLRKIFKSRTFTDAAKQLQEKTKIGVTPEGLITVSVTWYDKRLAADIANTYIEELDRFNTETAMTVGKKYRIFIEKRLKDNTNTLAQVEVALKDFQERHRTIVLDEEIKNAITTIAQLKSQIILLEVKRDALATSVQINNPYLVDINRELNELKKQLSRIEFGTKGQKTSEFGAGFAVPFSELPEVSLEYARLWRNVRVQSEIYTLLTQQYEQAKIMEVKDTPTVQVLDRASPPEKKSLPMRSRIVVLTSAFCLLLGIGGAFALESFEKTKRYPDHYKKWLDIWANIRSDVRTIKTFVFRILHVKKKSK